MGRTQTRRKAIRRLTWRSKKANKGRKPGLGRGRR